jgi:alpha-N-arabinofuranosidase
MRSARLSIHPDRVVGPVNRRLFGSFIEHLGRAVYGGIHEPGHPTADAAGFRRDVIDLVRELGVTTIRYPGGNFVSGFRWEDSVGPVASRPRRLDLAWHSTETNEVGLHEFQDWLDRVGCELMLAVNLGTRGLAEALDLLEYANMRGGTALADARIRNGRVDPFDIRMWCLGNEMDGPWQLGHRSADDYGRLAAQTAGAMRAFDPDLELVVCGSSGRSMPTFGAWERTVLGHTYELVDYISCHAYYENHDDLASFLASSIDMDRFIVEVTGIADQVKAEKGSDHTVNISFDEWNVWYMTRFNAEEKITDRDHWPIAPRLLEDVYSVADAVVVGSLVITLLRHSDRVASASLAQLVNVIAPIMTQPQGPAWRQTTFFPFAETAHHARGVALAGEVVSDSYPTAEYGSAPFVDAVATHDISGALSIYAVNRAQDGPSLFEVDLSPFGAEFDVEALTLHDDDPSAANTAEDPTRVGLKPNSTARIGGGQLSLELPPVSWTQILLRPTRVPAAERP